jgi:RsiW-degrading membrane proteinase PrsW (M82 family)
MSSFFSIFFSILGGVLPALLWLWFWLKEDRLHPEPKMRIAISFICGSLAVWPAIELERYFCQLISPGVCLGGMVPGLFLIFIWAIIEELLKYLSAFLSSFWKNKYNDEPIDQVIYLLTVALGFSAIENTLFLINDISNNNLLSSLITGNLRFIGASLLHVLASGAIGVFLSFSFDSGKLSKIFHGLFGLMVAVTYHSIFNIFIMKSSNWGAFMVFCFVWVSIFMLLAAFEKVKNLEKIRI